MQRYEKYKDSGIKWLGEIPEHWEVRKIKYLFNEINERALDGSGDLLSVSQYSGVQKKADKLNEGDLLTNASTLEGYKVVRKKQLVSNIMLAWNGSLAFSDYDGITSPAYCVYELQANNYYKYFHYLLKTGIYKSEFKRKSSGVIESRLRLYTEDFFSISSILPPIHEQYSIANFLDNKCEKIDAAVNLKEQQIEKLKELRQITIHHAITKGIPHVKGEVVPTKDSGIDWIGEIPKHWEIKRLKYIFSILKRIAGREGYDVLSITQKGIKVKDVKSGEGQLAMDYSKYQLAYKGEFAMNHMDLLTGWVDISEHDGVISPDYRVFTLINNRNFSPYFLFVLQDCYSSKIFYAHGQGVSMLGRWRFPTENFNNFFFPIPPLTEQKAIVAFLQEQTSKIDKAILQKQEQIVKLKEYKQSLINDVVTGKIKVAV
ncbi:restriction endonuclease subunit S [Sphingobacterium multivorum]|uniref:restriction endonuclease subunit S n=1 Tax=Sphingobacterium multivorum TaxID=28454 RepID=UPI0028A87C63|nr:restriction endonuclease subunit S [Sphingobacterium multivorum]